MTVFGNLESKTYQRSHRLPPAVRNLWRRLEEPVSSLSHLFGLFLACSGWAALLYLSWGEIEKSVVFSIYGATMAMTYAASAALHSLPRHRAWRHFLLRLDHAAIFLYIGGTYTPVCWLCLEPGTGRPMLAVMWSLALAGVLFKILFIHAPHWLSTASYWLISMAAIALVWPLLQILPPEAIAWMFLGGACYFFGSFVFYFRKPNPFPGLFGFHEIWHFMVLAGTGCHLMLMLRFIA
ncbi:MAG: hemolysin III family protein [Planctomycetota bacterium]|nr:MAG: hemolysin III family protein [Planctomycetota bacterium]